MLTIILLRVDLLQKVKNMKIIKQIHSGIVTPYKGALIDGLDQYPLFCKQICNKISQTIFDEAVTSKRTLFALVSFRCEVSFTEAIRIVEEEISGNKECTVEAQPLQGKRLVFGRLRHLLGKVSVESVRPLPNMSAPETCLMDELTSPIIMPGDTLRIDNHNGFDEFNPVSLFLSDYTKGIYLFDLGRNIPTSHSILFVDLHPE